MKLKNAIDKSTNRIKISMNEYGKGDFTPLQEYEIFRKMVYLNFKYTKNNKELFLKNFGKQDFVWHGEYSNYAWGFQLPSGRLIIFSGRKGTSFEFDGAHLTKEDIKLIKSLFEKT